MLPPGPIRTPLVPRRFGRPVLPLVDVRRADIGELAQIGAEENLSARMLDQEKTEKMIFVTMTRHGAYL